MVTTFFTLQCIYLSIQSSDPSLPSTNAQYLHHNVPLIYVFKNQIVKNAMEIKKKSPEGFEMIIVIPR